MKTHHRHPTVLHLSSSWLFPQPRQSFLSSISLVYFFLYALQIGKHQKISFCEKLTSLCHCRHHKILYYFSFERILLDLREHWIAMAHIEKAQTSHHKFLFPKKKINDQGIFVCSLAQHKLLSVINYVACDARRRIMFLCKWDGEATYTCTLHLSTSSVALKSSLKS
jgi:hypothetical protein